MKLGDRVTARVKNGVHSLSITDVCYEDEGQYMLIAKSRAGTNSCSGYLRIKENTITPNISTEDIDIDQMERSYSLDDSDADLGWDENVSIIEEFTP